MENANYKKFVEIIPAKLHDNKIIFDDDPKELGRKIDQGQIYIFRGVFSEEDMLSLRRAIIDWGSETEEYPKGISASKPGINFHRLDDGSYPSSMPHIFHQYGFADYNILNPNLKKKVTDVANSLVDLQNLLANTNFSLDQEEVRIKAIRHPRGGGFLAKHTHPYLPQKVSLFLNVSQPGVDYKSGGTRFMVDGKWIETDEFFLMGDILGWRYDMVHEVTPIEPESSLDWSGDDGHWLFAMEMTTAHPRSKRV